MIEVILGPTLVFVFRIIGAWPGCRNVCIRTFIWLFMVLTITCQVRFLLDYEQHNMDSLMEVVAVTITNGLSLQKIFNLWNNRRYIEQCLDMMKEDWKNISNNEHLAFMLRYAKIARRSRICVMGSYYCAFLNFLIRVLYKYILEASDYKKRELLIMTKYPFDVFRSPTYEIFTIVAMGQGFWVTSGNVMADSLLIAMIAHVSGQCVVLQDRIHRLSDTEELPGIIQKHQRIIHFAENIALTFKWIGLAEFISGSIIICAIGFVLVTTLESNLDSITMMKFGTYILAMTLGVFIYCCAGNILIEETLGIRDAVYSSCWINLPPRTSKILIMIMMRADKPICITAGNFFAMNYESFINIMKTAASYLSVIKASSE